MGIVPPTDNEGPWLLKDGIALAAGAHTFIPLVTYGEAREPKKYDGGDTFMTVGTATGRPNLDVGPEHTVTLRATAQNTAFCDFECRIWVDENGRLRIANATTPTLDKPGAIPTDTEVSTALLLIAELSSWMRWQDAQRIGDGQAALTDDSKINLAETVLRQRLEEGRLSARGRRRGALEYEKSPLTFGKSFIWISNETRVLFGARR